MEPEILPEGSPVPLNDLGVNCSNENLTKYCINIHSCSPEPKALVEKVGEFANPPWWLQVQSIHIYVGSVHSVRVELTPIFTVYLEICSLLRDLSGAFKGLSSFFPFRNNIIMDWYWCTGHLLRTPLPGTSKPWNMISWGTTGLCLVYLVNLAIITFTYQGNCTWGGARADLGGGWWSSGGEGQADEEGGRQTALC